MPKYIFAGSATISVYTVVEADSYEEAREEAENRDTELEPGNPHIEEESWTTDELDGEVYNIRYEGRGIQI